MSGANVDAARPKVSICVVNYKTALLTRLCVRSIRRFTPRPYELIVVDNDSRDESLEYLRSVKWIKLVERKIEHVKSGSWVHGTALDAGFAAATGDFFVSLHSDTIIHREGWLDLLMRPALENPRLACSGCGKLDLKPRWLMFLKACTDVKEWLRKLRPTKRRDFYVRTICALYRAEVLRERKLTFAMDTENNMTCGQQLYYELLDAGVPVNVVPERTMAAYAHHLAHATMALNKDSGEFKVRDRTERKCLAALRRILESPQTKAILEDESLDR